MDNWIISSSNRKVHVVLACITCENVILLTTKDEILRAKSNNESQTMNLFVPTVCSSCEKGEEVSQGFSHGIEKRHEAIWTSLSISCGMIQTWQPFSAMKAFLEGKLSVQTPKVKLVQRDEVRDMVGLDYMARSVLLDYSTGQAAEVHPYLQSGFF
ncbi:hypothetical protein BDZ45DRAFT_459250 [Acephala macrosclerotiorum]|nr:hypothetical protein BDZ45DRAFT_459250 [Acephala macrosclerotiorum]